MLADSGWGADRIDDSRPPPDRTSRPVGTNRHGHGPSHANRQHFVHKSARTGSPTPTAWLGSATATALTDWLLVRRVSRGTRGRLCDRSHRMLAGVQADTRFLRWQDSLLVAAHSRTLKRTVLQRTSTPASQPWGVSPRGHGSTAAPAGFGVAPQPRGLTPIGCWSRLTREYSNGRCRHEPLRQRASRGASAPGVTARLPPLQGSGSCRNPEGLRPSAAGRGSLANTQTGGAVTDLNASEPAVGRQPPGSRLHGHPRRVRGRAATPRAYAHRLQVAAHSRTLKRAVPPRASAPASQPRGVSPRGHGSTAAPAGFGVVSQPRGLTPIGCWSRLTREY